MFSWTELSLQPQGCESHLWCVSSQKLTAAPPTAPPCPAPAAVRGATDAISWPRSWAGAGSAWVVAVGRARFTLPGTAVAPLGGVSTTSKQETGQLGLSVNYTAQRQLSCLPGLLQAGPWQELPCQCYISTFAQRLHHCQLALPAPSSS